jgi:hypothetical protein
MADVEIATIITQGVAAARPAAADALEYYATDTKVRSWSNGSSWSDQPATGRVSAGTSNPGSPSSGDQFFRTDLGLYIYYDGTRWLTTTLYHVPIPWSGQATQLPIVVGSNSHRMVFSYTPDYDIYIINCAVIYRVDTTNTGSAFWTFDVQRQNAGTSLGTVTSAAASPDVRTRGTITIGAVMDVSDVNYQALQTQESKTGSPGGLNFLEYTLTYRLIVT